MERASAPGLLAAIPGGRERRFGSLFEDMLSL